MNLARSLRVRIEKLEDKREPDETIFLPLLPERVLNQPACAHMRDPRSWGKWITICTGPGGAIRL